MQRAAFGWQRAAFGYLFFNVVYQVSSSEIEVKTKFQEEMKEILKLTFYSFRVPRH